MGGIEDSDLSQKFRFLKFILYVSALDNVTEATTEQNVAAGLSTDAN